MNAVTGLSGSGRRTFRFVEALTEAGVTCGLNKELALELTVQTLVGAVGMLRQNARVNCAWLSPHQAGRRKPVCAPWRKAVFGKRSSRPYGARRSGRRYPPSCP